jgi:predicted GNAT superfamily acetyltransferase
MKHRAAAKVNKMPILLNKTIRLFLDSIGRREEYEYYLDRFQHARTAAFAVLCPERSGFEEVAPVFTFDLITLLRLELFPVIALCGSAAGEMCTMLLREEHPYRIFDWPTGDGSGRDASPVDVLTAFIGECRAQGCITIIRAAEVTLPDLLQDLVPMVSRRVHLIRPAGQLRSRAGQALSYYYTARPESPELADEDIWIRDLAEELLAHFPSTHVSVASPWNLLEELFTVKGAGCVLRRGSIIEHTRDMDTLDRIRLAGLLEQSFGRRLRGDGFLEHLAEAYFERDYRGAALLEKTDEGMYLSKFAVGVEARGSGLAQELWQLLDRDHSQLFWRARAANPVNQWYEKQADGFHRAGDWRIFWRGIDADHISAIIRYSLERPEDFLRT